MKTLAIAFILLAALVAPGCGGGGGSSSGGWSDDGRSSGTCKMTTVVKADYCATCRTFCGAACPVDAKGNCKACGNATTKKDACVKTYWACDQCKSNHDDGVCKLNDSYQCCTKSESKSPIQCGCGPSCAGASCAKCKEKGGCKPRCLH